MTRATCLLSSCLLLSAPAFAGDLVEVTAVKTDNEDAAKLVRKVIDKEIARLDKCGEKAAESDKGSQRADLRVTLGPKGGSVSPVRDDDASNPHVACAGRALAGIDWPKASRKISVTVSLRLGNAG